MNLGRLDPASALRVGCRGSSSRATPASARASLRRSDNVTHPSANQPLIGRGTALRRRRIAVAAAATEAGADAAPAASNEANQRPGDRGETASQFRLDADAHLIAGLAQINATREARPAEAVTVGQDRLIVDPAELGLIGSGLPVIDGPNWPDQYFEALKAMSAGREVPLPRPHPKFTRQDLERLASSPGGPRLADLVVEHAEAGEVEAEAAEGGRTEAGQAYAYIPRAVLGDYRHEVEPDWRSLPQMSIVQLYDGLRQRNWTSPYYRPDAEPWRLQLFSCEYL
ncbi:hypothetical protein GPECTOR_109g211 [Gonium pectorale]|uniref:Uncharacterized protein n=1 Tax=Gonium pectorale TaxID=33097 RepID=A0A150FZF3_GONPE|nr:hypothetical protein GPECTOR_109g211 [Gonium pectorale]|eukprot:KXZ42968.1 hypothetical protein GPECTOR_109g211 [Gonium pectorale]